MARSTKPSLFLQALLCAATIAAAAAASDVASYSLPVFDATTTDILVVATNSSVLRSAELLFQSGPVFANFNASEGFLLLTGNIDVWRAGGAGSRGEPSSEASFNTSFTVDRSASPVAFVVLLDRFPTLNNPNGLHGDGNTTGTGAVPNATNGLAAVEVGTVKSYAPESPAVGLNVTITLNATAATTSGSTAVWIEYDAVAHVLRVYVAAAGEGRPAEALLLAPLDLAAGSRTTQTALVGFFAQTVRDIITGVRDWDLTVDRLSTNSNGGGRKWPSWVLILMAVIGSVAATV